jgi:hypothetical protein
MALLAKCEGHCGPRESGLIRGRAAMTKPKKLKLARAKAPAVRTDADRLFDEVAGILEEARRQTVRTVNTNMVSAYWLIGWRIVEAEQGGRARAG